ncbi:MAG: glycoside hydrolase family 97 protein [Bacteroidaceae bacterium]|nr:glycoside hydrolase family 97 protein [Bacteroidaceae bacterium]
MNTRQIVLWAAALLLAAPASAQKSFELTSPDGKVKTNIQVGQTLSYDLQVDGRQVVAPSALTMKTSTGVEWGVSPKLKGQKRSSLNEMVPSPLTRQSEMKNECNVLLLTFAGDYQVEFRAYNEGVAYRYIYTGKKPFEVISEGVEYRLPADYTCIVPYVRDFNENSPSRQFQNSFENTYTTDAVSKLDGRRYCFLPLVVDAGIGVKLCITETHLENYPGLYLQADGQRFRGVNAPYPKDVKQGGHNNLQMQVQSVENFIAKVGGARSFPWRITMVARKDIELAQNNLSYLLAAPSELTDISWVKPGKVAWDWWNDWNISGVPFKSGVNNETYKYYIDFAAQKGIEYVILDEGWAVNKKADLFQVIPEIDLKGLVDYGRQKGVGIILWAGYWAFDRDMEKVCKYYSEMGVKGFKVDFMDRDDQLMTDFYYRAAAMGAKYHLMVDFHGAFKPAGLNRTYPNVVNFEGVNGLEQLKWSPATLDQPQYDCQIPFIRQAAGPMDYTQGAMLNAAKGHYQPCNSEPMSMGTRCHQLGLYMILESPLSMLCDSPTHYLELGGPCTDFIAKVPTVWDETIVLAGEIGKYIVTARRSGSTWYVGGITNWDARDVEVPTAFLGSGTFHVEAFTDGANAHRKGDDYLFQQGDVRSDGRAVKVYMAPGGGFAAKITK